jgi:hypothetical protein
MLIILQKIQGIIILNFIRRHNLEDIDFKVTGGCL